MSEYTVSVHRTPTVTHVAVRGEIDATVAGDVERRIAEAQDEGPVVLDCEGVEFIDSTGVSVLLRSNKRAATTGVPFALARPSAAVTRLLTVLGLHDRFVLVHDVPEVGGPGSD